LIKKKNETISKPNPVKKWLLLIYSFLIPHATSCLKQRILPTTQQIPTAKNVVKSARIIASIVISFPQMPGELIMQFFASCALTSS
jgi:hypothetical protein